MQFPASHSSHLSAISAFFQWNLPTAAQTNSLNLSWRVCWGRTKRPGRIVDIRKRSCRSTKVKFCCCRDQNKTTAKHYAAVGSVCQSGDPCLLALESAHPRSPPPRTNLDPKAKSVPRKSANLSGKASQEPHGQTRKSNTSPNCYEQDGGQEQWEKATGEGSRGKCKSAWKPVREVLNVDNILNELEQRRQNQHDGKLPPQEIANMEEIQEQERENIRMREERKQMCLMTIYEDEQRHESESHSSMDSEIRVNQQRASKLRSGPKTLLRSDTWTIQRTESGYESSDRLSSGSTNPDSPGVDGLMAKEQGSAAETQQQRWEMTQRQLRKNPGTTSRVPRALQSGVLLRICVWC